VLSAIKSQMLALVRHHFKMLFRLNLIKLGSGLTDSDPVTDLRKLTLTTRNNNNKPM